MEIRFDTYYDNDELAAALASLVAARPDLAEVRSLGTSTEGRDLPLLVVTNSGTGPDTDKPGFWLDGNMHAVEVAGSMACLHAAHLLVTKYGTDPKVTRLLDDVVFYIAPRLSPDGVASVMQTPPHLVLSSPRHYRDADEDGLHPDDVDGDGRILEMRVVDPTGNFKVSEQDPRLMVRREPEDEGGTYYRVFTEGTVAGWDGHTIAPADTPDGVNFNRNFPVSWAGEATESGAGHFPLSEPETRAVARFLSEHPNVFGAVNYHTFSGVHLRPYGFQADDIMPLDDLHLYQLIGERATGFTGYPAVSIHHGFRYHPRKVLHGNLIDWLYDDLGVLCWTTELWDVVSRAGIGDHTDFIGWFRHHPEADDLKLLAWQDERLGGSGFVPWYPVDHPQLGAVELGGWDRLFTWNNPPRDMLEDELRGNTDFVLFSAALTPRLGIREFSAAPLGPERYAVTLVVENTGFLSTSGTSKAVERGVVRPVRATVSGAQVVAGKPTTELGQLAGRASKMQYTGFSPTSASITDDRARAEWVLAAPAGTEITVEVSSERAGTVRRSAVLQ